MKANRWIQALTAGLAAVSLAACSGSEAHESTTTDSVPARQVETITVVRDTITIGEEYTATLRASVTNNISAQAGGRLAQLNVKVGDRVSRGQVIARLDATQLNQAHIQLQDAKLNYERVSELYNIGGISKVQWEQARSAMNIAQNAYDNLLTNTTLVSPTAGVVTAKNYDVGDMTSPALPVVVVEQISPVKALINVSEGHYSRLKKGLPTTVLVDALGEEAFAAYISTVHPTVDARTHTITVEVEVPNKDERLRPGMYSRVQLNLGKREALLVPDAALQRMSGSGQRYVYVYNNGVAEYRALEVGKLHGDRYEVLSGLEAGERVITAGASTLTNGAKVTI